MQNIVVLGAGHWHLPLYREALRAQHRVIGVCDTDPKAAAKATADLAAPSSDTASDGARLRVGPRLRPRCARPNARNLSAAHRRPDAVRAGEAGRGCRRRPRRRPGRGRGCGVPATVPLVQRYGPLPHLLHQVGRLRHLRFSFIAGPPSRYTASGCGWVLDRTVSGGGCLYLLGVHFTDLLHHVTGAEIVAARSVRQYPAGATIEDYGVLTLEAADGTTATVEIGWTFPDGPVKRYVNYTAAGDDGHIAIDTRGAVELHAPGRETAQHQVDVEQRRALPALPSKPSLPPTPPGSPACQPSPI